MSEYKEFIERLLSEPKEKTPEAIPIEDAVYSRFQAEFGLCDIPLARLRAIAEAERDGRLVVLPCKVGDPIWDIRYGEVRKHFAYQWHVVTGRPEQCFLSCEGWYCGLLDFGVTVFLTREAAEAALSAGKGKT